jgi:hypothetical protein
MTVLLQEVEALSAAAYLLVLVEADADTCAAATLVALCFGIHLQVAHGAAVRIAHGGTNALEKYKKRKRDGDDDDDKMWPSGVKRSRAVKAKACLRCKGRKVRSGKDCN